MLKSLVCRWSTLVLLLAGASLLEAQDLDSTRLILAVDYSFSNSKQIVGVRQVVGHLISNGFGGQLRSGDRYAIWIYAEEVLKSPWMIFATETRATDVALADQQLSRLKPKGMADFRKLLENVAPYARTNSPFTLVVISDGEDRIVGTPFDAKVNRIFEERGRVARRERRPFIVSLLAENAIWVRNTVGEVGYVVEFPLPTFNPAVLSFESGGTTLSPKPSLTLPTAKVSPKSSKPTEIRTKTAVPNAPESVGTAKSVEVPTATKTIVAEPNKSSEAGSADTSAKPRSNIVVTKESELPRAVEDRRANAPTNPQNIIVLTPSASESEPDRTVSRDKVDAPSTPFGNLTATPVKNQEPEVGVSASAVGSDSQQESMVEVPIKGDNRVVRSEDISESGRGTAPVKSSEERGESEPRPMQSNGEGVKETQTILNGHEPNKESHALPNEPAVLDSRTSQGMLAPIPAKPGSMNYLWAGLMFLLIGLCILLFRGTGAKSVRGASLISQSMDKHPGSNRKPGS